MKGMFQNRVAEIVNRDGTVNVSALRKWAYELDVLETKVSAAPARVQGASAGSAFVGAAQGRGAGGLVVANNIGANVGNAVHYTRGVLQLADNRMRVATHFVIRQDGERGTVTLETSGTARALLSTGAGLSDSAELYLGQNGLLTDDVSSIQGTNRRLLSGVKYFQVLATKAQANKKDFVNANWNVSLTARGD